MSKQPNSPQKSIRFFVKRVGILLLFLTILALGLILSGCEAVNINTNCSGNNVNCNNSSQSQ
jgi:hypothetical protein